jgi:hypothetical protein
MIGKWLETQPTEVLDRFLECRMIPFRRAVNHGEGCLMGVASGEAVSRIYVSDWWLPALQPLIRRFNRLCQRFAGVSRREQSDYGMLIFRSRYCGLVKEEAVRGYELRGYGEHLTDNFVTMKQARLGGARVGILIRNRVLAIKARRTLQGNWAARVLPGAREPVAVG